MRRSFTPKEMLRYPVFWLLFFMMSLMSTSGLMVTSNVGPFARDYHVADVLVLGMAALPLSLTLSRVTNGLTRPFFGWVSDHIGREYTMALAFTLEALAILLLFAFLDHPAMFVVMTGIAFFGWGEIFSLFPVDPDRYLRAEIRRDELRLSLYRAGCGIDPGRSGRGIPQADDGKLDGGVRHRRHSRCPDRAARSHSSADHATASYGGGVTRSVTMRLPHRGGSLCYRP